MEKPKRRYANVGVTGRVRAFVEINTYWGMPDNELVSLRGAAMVLNIKLQAVVKLGLPRYLVEKCAAYRKGDIQALLLADYTEPNELLRGLQEEHRQAQAKQKAHPSRRYKTRPDLLPDEAKAAKQATKSNRTPPTKEELASDPWEIAKKRSKMRRKRLAGFY